MLVPGDSLWMAQALRLAEGGLNSTSPNPRVGCVLVKNDRIVASGWHRKAGEPHAEINALCEAGAAARGATAYVTLEPCNHQGRTPPCTEALIAVGIARVVVAVVDPNPLVAGTGCEKLRAAGIKVECGLMESTARALNAGFFARMIRGTPLLRSKIGVSLDGRTALANGASKWITGQRARSDVQHWRARSCAVLTGINTVLADDPLLNVREIATERQPLRVIVDSNLRIPPEARILQGGAGGKVLIYALRRDEKRIAGLETLGAEVCVLPENSGRVALAALMADLAKRGCNEVLVEAGGKLNGALLTAGLVDELLLYVAPQLLGDAARGMAALGELASLDKSIKLEWMDARHVGDDMRLQMRVKNV
ncbi:MAG: bifunctional diaminohydroxyphosphoribosylaminopyrimidine deaminase/5-amino-6-(5-phosphoribosylamino)uracil reductase RibD [Gallionella sp.]